MHNTQPMKGILIVSDVDGTLATGSFTIPQRNIEAIDRFSREGGLFTIATGRPINSASIYVRKAHVNAPAIAFNGSGIYDFCKESYVWKSPLPDGIKTVIKEVYACFPDVGVDVFDGRDIYVIHRNELTMLHYGSENIEFKEGALDDAPVPWLKAMFTGSHERLLEVERFLRTLNAEGFYFMFSGERYLELIPSGVSKGTSMNILAAHLGINHDKTVAIGNFYNDVDLIKHAGIGAAVGDSPEEVKKAADIVVCSCESGAIADLIEYLEKKFS